jgi:hypothetical protein
MFFVDDNQDSRHQFIREYLTKKSAAIAIILASIDFEWMLRRAILALGKSETKDIRQKLRKLNGGYEGYKKMWHEEVQPRVGYSLDRAVKNWSKLHGDRSASAVRGSIVHGASVPISLERATIHVENWLTASKMLEKFALEREGLSLFLRIVRFKSR